MTSAAVPALVVLSDTDFSYRYGPFAEARAP